MGIIIDNSASMKTKRPESRARPLRGPVWPTPTRRTKSSSSTSTTTSTATSIHLRSQQAGPGTARIDSMSGTADGATLHPRGRSATPKAKGRHDKKGAGGDHRRRHNMSETTLDEVLHRGPTARGAGLRHRPACEEEHDAAKRAREALGEITRSTGGHVWYPTDVDEVGRIALQVARRHPEPVHSSPTRPPIPSWTAATARSASRSAAPIHPVAARAPATTPRRTWAPNPRAQASHFRPLSVQQFRTVSPSSDVLMDTRRDRCKSDCRSYRLFWRRWLPLPPPRSLPKRWRSGFRSRSPSIASTCCRRLFHQPFRRREQRPRGPHGLRQPAYGFSSWQRCGTRGYARAIQPGFPHEAATIPWR